MLEPLGQSQVLAYLKRLALHRRIYLISFEKSEDWAYLPERKRIADDIASSGIIWHPLRYHKRPSAVATLWDIFCGIMLGLWLVGRFRISIVHARSYVPSVITLALKRLTSVKYIFDMRGFWANERVDGGLWQENGHLYHVAKWFERQFLLNADVVVSLTYAAVNEMRTFPYLQNHIPSFDVITTCADLELFRPGQYSTEDRPFTLGYVGSVGVWYLFDETLRFFKSLRERLPDSRMLIMNRGSHDYIQDRLQALSIPLDAVEIHETDHAGVACAMQRMDAGIFFYKPTYSKKATAPTRLGEFLGCGVPCIGNSGVGDMAEILENEKVGIVVNSFDDQALHDAMEHLFQLMRTEGIRERCREVALRYFSLDEGVQRYASVYERLDLLS
jgi:glycosyltransferase involved in cell wall biosynthesis